ncbi:ATP-binding protein [Azoarcus olearius]|uniref:histidine kinase n=1 Tax=Azoarcus sp. (strain BH72) TaxID=418699 RepID=A1KB48_AZOSB|nr:ATP-binding protein [Azoarcus olearius]ANQ86598.1 putative virulence regulator protein [Azoarcus olearius]CAL96054.1 putative virulence regulator protein [Azoarcus olearius]
MMLRSGVRARVMLAAVLPMLVLALVLTVSFTHSRLADLDAALTARGQAYARQLAAASEYAVFSGNREALQQLASAVLSEEDVVGVSIVDHNGDALARSGILDAQLPPLPVSAVAAPARLVQGPTLRLIEPIRPSRLELDDGFTSISPDSAAQLGGAQLGSVVLELSLKRLNSRRDELLWTSAGSVLLVLVGSLLLASHLSRGVSGPIRIVAETVTRIGQGRLGERVPVIGGGSLRTLAEGVNEMAWRLATSHEEMARKIEEATAELRARKEEAERANLAKSRFLAAASHDLRQPMHALGLFISELAQQSSSHHERRLVQRIAASAEAMENLLDSLLDISKLDAGVLQPNIRTFALEPLLDRLATQMSSAAAEHDLAFKVRPCAAWIESDPVLFERILTNLVSNALRYTPQGRVLVACRRRRNRLRVEVRDSGIGIAPEAQEIIFQEFVQLDNDERARDKGLGLGLAIVRRLASLMGHRLDLRSAPGRGSVFAIEVPLAPPQPTLAAEDGTRAPGDLGGVVIAVVDDDALARSGMEGLLTAWGCEVIAAETPADLLAALSAHRPPQLVISDFSLHGSHNGVDIIAALRQQVGPGLAAVLISGDTGPEAQRLAQDAGVPLLHKPVRPARLRALLHRLLHND